MRQRGSSTFDVTHKFESRTRQDFYSFIIGGGGEPAKGRVRQSGRSNLIYAEFDIGQLFRMKWYK